MSQYVILKQFDLMETEWRKWAKTMSLFPFIYIVLKIELNKPKPNHQNN